MDAAAESWGATGLPALSPGGAPVDATAELCAWPALPELSPSPSGPDILPGWNAMISLAALRLLIAAGSALGSVFGTVGSGPLFVAVV